VNDVDFISVIDWNPVFMGMIRGLKASVNFLLGDGRWMIYLMRWRWF